MNDTAIEPENPPIFLKLGGSLITEKDRPRTPRLNTINRLASEISTAFARKPNLRLVLGHGAGSFGHVSAQEHGTRAGVRTPEEWRGFAEVWWDASTLNRMVMEALQSAGLPAIAFPPSAGVTAHDGQVARWDLYPLKAALREGLLPVVYGDVIFDVHRGGTILSTEDLFAHLARELHPSRILLAGIEPGVWADYPQCTRLVHEITSENIAEIAMGLGGSVAADVTGGMESKVHHSLELVLANPGSEVLIFSGEERRTVRETLLGGKFGTVVTSGNRNHHSPEQPIV
jgi:isopentenyl phosphate kinase